MCIEEDLIGFIYELIMTNFIDLANNINGLCVVKKIIIHTTKDETAWKILNLILERIFQLVQNPYGNYVIQVALDVRVNFNFSRPGQTTSFSLSF